MLWLLWEGADGSDRSMLDRATNVQDGDDLRL